MRLLDFEQVQVQAQNEDAAVHCISGVSRVLFLAALEQIQERYQWVSGNQEISDGEFDDIEAWVSNACSELMVVCELVGEIIMVVNSVEPSRTLLCDGAEYSNEDYPELYAVLPPQLQNPDGIHFTTPNLCGRSPRGDGQDEWGERLSVTQTGGEKTHVLTQDEMPTHRHNITTILYGQVGSGTLVPYVGLGVDYPTTWAGGDEAHNNLHPFYVVRFVIRCGREVL